LVLPLFSDYSLWEMYTYLLEVKRRVQDLSVLNPPILRKSSRMPSRD
jgi:hypothetical protein